MGNEVTKINTNRQIKQSNNLCEARYKLTKYEQRMVIAICSQIDDRKDELPIIKVKVTDLANFCEFDKTKKYTMVKTTARTLRSRTLEYKMPNGDWYITGWINSAFYNSKDGTITFTFDERLKPELLNLKSAYLLTPTEPLMKFDRDYSVRLYFILKKMLKIKDFEYSLDYFRDRFQLGKGYKLFANLKNKVLEPALDEINEKSDISVWHEYIKEGRAHTKIHFIVTSKEKTPRTPADEPAEQSPQATFLAESKETEKKDTEDVYEKAEFFATAPVMTVAKNSADVGNRANWTEEQQADYDMLIKIEVWATIAEQCVNTYDHARIERNYKGVMRDSKKGTIANLPAVVAGAIKNDSYKGVEEEQQKLVEREQNKRKAKWQKAEQEKEEQKAKVKAKQEEMARIREQYTTKELNAVMKEVKIDYNNSGKLTEDMKNKLNRYGITVQQFYIYRTNGKKFGDFDMRSGRLEKAVKKETDIDLEIDLNDAESVEKIIEIYYQNGKRCPDIILKKFKEKGLIWNNFMIKNYKKFADFTKING